MNPTLLPLAAAIFLFALAVLVILKESGRGRGGLALGLLLVAVVELFDGLAIHGLGSFTASMRIVLVAKSLLPAAFLLYGMQFIRKGSGTSPVLVAAPFLMIAAVFSAAALALPVEQFYAGLDREPARLLALGRAGYWFYLGLMIFCIAALVNLESVFAGIRGGDRWRVKYEFLGVGAILAIMIFYFSQGLLYKAMNPDLLPARSGVVIVAAFLIGYSRLYRGRTANLAVSRRALYRSFTLVGVGLYLLFLGLLGEGMRWFNVTVTRTLTVFIAILSALAFLALLLSEEIRRRLRVYLSKHFYAQKHDYREEWLGFSNALAGCRSLRDAQAVIVERYQQLFGLQSAALYTREAQDVFAIVATRDTSGLPGRVRLSPPLLRYFAETGRVLNPVDGEYAPAQEEAEFLRDAGLWLLVPLMAGDRLDAFVVLGRQIVPEKLTYEDFDLMKVLGRQAALALNNYRLAEELLEAREMAAVAKVSSFVIHDLKNLAYTFSLILENAEEHIAEADFQRDLVSSIRSTVAKMNGLIAKLKAPPGKQELRIEAADAAEVVRETAAEVGRMKPAVAIVAECAPTRARFDAQELRKIVLNLLLNACDAVGADGRVLVRTGPLGGGEAFVEVEDNGCGMSQTFIATQLFRPFRTTKEKGLGIGLYQCRQTVEAQGGRIDVESVEGKGTVFRVVLPGAAQGQG